MPGYGHFYPPPPPFQGGRQPLDPRRLTPTSNPPATDDPPFGHAPRVAPEYWIILGAWVPGPPLPTLVRRVPVSVAAVPVDDPPWDAEHRADLALLLTLWQPAPPQPWVPRLLVPASVDDPPFGARLPSPIFGQWQPAPWWPAPPRPVPQPFLAAGDDPPFGARTSLPTILRSWLWRPIGSPSGAPPEPPPPVNDPPFAAQRWLHRVVDRWTPRTAMPLWGPALDLPDIPDNPVGAPFPWLESTVATWRTVPTPSQARRFVVQAAAAISADSPPFGLDPWLSAVLRTWQPGAPQPWRPSWLVQGTAGAVDDPPFGMPPTWLAGVLTTWRSGPWSAQSARELAPALTVIQVDDPPFGARPWLTTAVATWRPGDPLQLRPRYLVQPATAAADDPPFGLRGPWSAAFAWQAAPQIQALGRPVAPLLTPVADEPPLGLRAWLATVLGLWLPAQTPIHIARYLPQDGTVIISDPPFGRRGYDGLFAHREWWEPPIPQQRTAVAMQARLLGGYVFVAPGRERIFVVPPRTESP